MVSSRSVKIWALLEKTEISCCLNIHPEAVNEEFLNVATCNSGNKYIGVENISELVIGQSFGCACF